MGYHLNGILRNDLSHYLSQNTCQLMSGQKTDQTNPNKGRTSGKPKCVHYNKPKMAARYTLNTDEYNVIIIIIPIRL